MAGADDGPGHIAAVAVEQFEFAQALVAAITRPGIVLGLFGLRKTAMGWVEDEVGGDKG